jgi:hypothetical protein
VRILVLYLAACSGQGSSAPAEPVAIEVRDGNRRIARVVPGHPCRAELGDVAMQVGGPPLVAQVGDTSWTGEDGSNGTTLRENGAYVARVYTAGGTTGVFDGQGVPLFRVTVTGDTAGVSDAASRPLRAVTRTKSGLAVDGLAITGTDDLVLAAILTAREARPEIRALAACRQLFGGTIP